jgi:ESCRT-II complex subunit VPS36
MLLLTDVYCLVNRARGTQLISPLDCVNACQLFPQLATPLRLREFPDTGVKVLCADQQTEGQIVQRIRQMLQEEVRHLSKQYAPGTAAFLHHSPSVSPLQLSNRWHISIVLAKQYLFLAEQSAVVCRDESIHGLTFYINLFGG